MIVNIVFPVRMYYNIVNFGCGIIEYIHGRNLKSSLLKIMLFMFVGVVK